jgi:hypothetical protein
MYENWFVAEYLINQGQREIERMAREAWKWENAGKSSNRLLWKRQTAGNSSSRPLWKPQLMRATTACCTPNCC